MFSAKKSFPPFSADRATFLADGFVASEVRASLDAYGCALIKGLFEPRRLSVFDERIERNSIG